MSRAAAASGLDWQVGAVTFLVARPDGDGLPEEESLTVINPRYP